MALLLMGLLVLRLLAVLDSAWGHVDITLLPCDPHDQMQLWTMPARGMGYGGTLSHQSTKLCLMPQGCDVDEGTPLVLDDCASSCVSSDAVADQFLLHHNHGTHPRGLQAQEMGANNTALLFVTASSGDSAATLMPWDAESPGDQEWMTATPFQGPNHILQVGNGEDGQSLCATTGGEGCCLGVRDNEVSLGLVIMFAPLAGGVLLAMVVAGAVGTGLRKRNADSAFGDGSGGGNVAHEPRESLPFGSVPSSLSDPLLATEVGSNALPPKPEVNAEAFSPDAWVPVPGSQQLDSSVDVGFVFADIEGSVDGQAYVVDDGTPRMWTSLESSVAVDGGCGYTADSIADTLGTGAASHDFVAVSPYRTNLSEAEEVATLIEETPEDLVGVLTEGGSDALETLFAADLLSPSSPFDGGSPPRGPTGTASLHETSFPAGVPGTPADARKYHCPFPGCGHTAEREGHLADHVKTHTGEKPFACPYPGCTYRSAGKGHVTRHVRSHTKEKPYRCTYPGCGFASSQSNHVTAHMRKHTGERPFACDVSGCDYTAARAWLVTRHKSTRHGIGGGSGSTASARDNAETQPPNGAVRAVISDASVEVCNATPEATTPPQLSQTQMQTQQPIQVVQAMQPVQVAPISLGASTAAAPASSTPVYATDVTAEEGSHQCEQWQVELSPGVWSDFPVPTMRTYSGQNVLRACVPACLRACVPACLRACVPACLPACLAACLPACLRVCVSACLPLSASVCVPVRLPLCCNNECNH